MEKRLLILLLLIIGNVNGVVVNPGESINSAINSAGPGDTVLIKSGNYNENLNIQSSGLPGNYLQIIGEGRPVVNGRVEIYGKSHLVFESIEFANSDSYGIKCNDCDNLVFRDIIVHHSVHGGMVFEKGDTNILIENCSIHHTNQMGGGAWHEAVSFAGTDGFEIRYSSVHDCKEEGIDAKYGAINGKIHHNEIYGNNGPNIYIDAASHVDIYNNNIYGSGANKAGIGLSVEHAYNVARKPTTDIRIYNNIVHHNYGGLWFWVESGAESYGEFKNIKVINNVIADNGNWGGVAFMGTSDQIYTTGNVFRNNIFWNDDIGSGPIDRFVFDHNLFSGDAVGADSVVTQDMKWQDYRPSIGSPAIDAGSAVDAPGTDYSDSKRFQGSAVDIGAYEFGEAGLPETCGDAICEGDESCLTCPNDCKKIHDSDSIPCDGCVRQDEMMGYITKWKNGQATLAQLMGAIGIWKSGC